MYGFNLDRLETLQFIRSKNTHVIKSSNSAFNNSRKNDSNTINNETLIDFKF